MLEELLADATAPRTSPGLPRFTRRGGRLRRLRHGPLRRATCPTPRRTTAACPTCRFAFYDRMVIFDHINKTIAAVAHAHVDPADLRGRYDAACDRVDRLVERLQQGVADLQLTDIDAVGRRRRARTSRTSPAAAFEAAVEKCKEYIKAGDIFQVVLSQRLQTETQARPFDIYRTLRVVNPSPFLFYLDAGAVCLVGSSPEIMAARRGRPGDDPPAGRHAAARQRRRRRTTRLAAELLADPKERAEHIMLVDLGRNDVGRVARFGTVQLQRRADGRALQPRHAPVQHRDGPAAAGQDGVRRAAVVPAGGHAVGSAEGAGDGDHRRAGAAPPRARTAGRSATSTSAATWTRASPCGRWCCKGQTAYLQAGAGIVADSVPGERVRGDDEQGGGCCGRSRWPRRSYNRMQDEECRTQNRREDHPPPSLARFCCLSFSVFVLHSRILERAGDLRRLPRAPGAVSPPPPAHFNRQSRPLFVSGLLDFVGILFAALRLPALRRPGDPHQPERELAGPSGFWARRSTARVCWRSGASGCSARCCTSSSW